MEGERQRDSTGGERAAAEADKGRQPGECLAGKEVRAAHEDGGRERRLWLVECREDVNM